MDYKKALFIICAAAFILRLSLVLQAQSFDYSAYETIRQVENIKDTGLPIIHDTLSAAGRTSLPLPVFPYLLAFSTLFMPDKYAFLIVPSLFAVLLQLALFYLILELTNDTRLSLLGAAASIFLPSYMSATLLTLSAATIAIPMFIVIVTLFLKLRKTQEKRNVLLALFILLSFTHSLAILFIPFVVLSMLLMSIKRARGETGQLEFAIFSIFYLVWFYLLLYKRSLEELGARTLQANIPSAALAAVYSDVNIFTVTAAIGVIPFGLMLYTAYKEGNGEHLGILTTLSLAITLAVIIILQLIPLELGTALFSAVCIALAIVGVQHLWRYSRTLRKKTVPHVAAAAIAALFILTSVLPTVISGIDSVQHTADPNVLDAASWLSQNSLQTNIVLAQPEWGFAIETVAKRPAYIDEHYLDVPDASERYELVQELLSSKQPSIEAHEAHVDYIMSAEKLNDPCINTVYGSKVYIGKVLCK